MSNGAGRTVRPAGRSSSTNLRSSDFHVASAMRRASNRADVRLIHRRRTDRGIARADAASRNPFALQSEGLASGHHARESGSSPISLSVLHFSDGSRRCFMVEIDRGTMPIVAQQSSRRRASSGRCAPTSPPMPPAARATIRLENISRAHGHDRPPPHAVDDGGVAQLHVPHSPGASLFFFATARRTAREPIHSRTHGVTATAATSSLDLAGERASSRLP